MMQENKDTLLFLNELTGEIAKKDRLHSKKINANVVALNEKFNSEFNELSGLVRQYFNKLHLTTERIATDYLKMIRDMRAEGVYFFKNGKYRCENQKIANEYVYSKPDVMTYYMNALLVSQILWKHHFNIFMDFQKNLKLLFKSDAPLKILDIGPGHGFFSFLVKKTFPGYRQLDIVDISDTSLEMTKNIIGFDDSKINYFKQDIFDYADTNKYDFIVLGEVIEHLDEPKKILQKLANLLNPGGYIWITAPTNSPALDHVYLFKSREEIINLIKDSGLDVTISFNYFAEDVDEQTAIKNRITDLVGVFCKNK